MSALTKEHVAAVFGVLSDAALSHAERQERPILGALWSGVGVNWSFKVVPSDTDITAQCKEVRETPSEAFADAVQLRDDLLAAAGQTDARGFVAADSANDRELAVSGWIGTVRLVIAVDR